MLCYSPEPFTDTLSSLPPSSSHPLATLSFSHLLYTPLSSLFSLSHSLSFISLPLSLLCAFVLGCPTNDLPWIISISLIGGILLLGLLLLLLIKMILVIKVGTYALVLLLLCNPTTAISCAWKFTPVVMKLWCELSVGSTIYIL